MSRFSPQVLPVANQTFLSNVANALARGTESYRETKDWKEARAERDRQVARQRDADFIKGISQEDPRAAAMPEATVPTDDFTAQVLQAPITPPPAEAQSASGLPGGWDPQFRGFAKAMEPLPLPSGAWYDRGRVMTQQLAEAAQRAEMEQAMATRARETRYGERATQLAALAGTPGFEELDAGMIHAGSDNDSLYNAIVLGDRGRNIDRLSPEGIAAAEDLARRTGAARAETAPSTVRNDRQDREREAEGAAWLASVENDPAISRLVPRALASVYQQMPHLAQRPGIAAYHAREALRKQGLMEKAVRVPATAAPNGRSIGAPPGAGGSRPAGTRPAAVVLPPGAPPVPDGVDPAEWIEYLKDTKQIP